MPERRTQDVVQVTMTDHDIQRRPPPAAVLLAPRAEADPTLTDLRLFDPERAPPGQDGELYRVLAVVRAHGAAAPAAVDRLAALLGALQPPAVEPWLDLTSAEADRGRWAAVERTLTTILARHPGQPQAPAWLGIARAALGRHDEAIALLRPAVERSPEDPATRFHLGRALLAAGRASEALPELERAVALRPNLAGARLLLGQTLEAAGRRDAAIEQYRQALAWEPRSTAGYLALARALLRSGATAEAGRYLRHGALVAADPEPLRAMLSAAER
jgi:tetratricopeptide (TPR) repeat protein